MARIKLTLACGDYDINAALVDGTVQPEGIDLTVIPLPSPERHWRMGRHMEFDISEFSMGTYLQARRFGTPFTAIPVFPHRRMRHSFILVNTQAGIRQPQDLNGKRIGLREYQNSAAIWIRGILQDEYGVDLRSITWVAQDVEDHPVELPPWVMLERAPEGDNLDSMLLRGDIAAAMYPELLPTFARGGSDKVGRLFSDSKAEEIAYYRKTGLFPLMHTVVVRDSVLEKYPWVANSMLKAFRESKRRAYRRMEDPRTVSLAWFRDTLEEQRRVMGPDPWPYDLGPSNRKALETMIRYEVEQGLLARPFTVDELFFESTLDETPQLLAVYTR